MHSRPVAIYLAQAYDRGAEQYRQDDEIEARSENHQRLGGNLRRICRSFSQPIRVLEVGCGTGRYFHWLENVKLLVGTDLSAEMLKRARTPVHAEEVTAAEIRLMQGDFYEMNFEPQSFDFIYSLGVFGYGAELREEVCAKFHRWLAPGGYLYFDAIENREYNGLDRVKQGVKKLVLPRLPQALRARVEARDPAPVYYHRRQEVERRMRAAGFPEVTLSSHECLSPLWKGVHLECVGRKATSEAPHTPGSDRKAATVGA